MTFLPFLLNRSRLPICSYNLFLFWPVTLKSVKKKSINACILINKISLNKKKTKKKKKNFMNVYNKKKKYKKKKKKYLFMYIDKQNQFKKKSTFFSILACNTSNTKLLIYSLSQHLTRLANDFPPFFAYLVKVPNMLLLFFSILACNTSNTKWLIYSLSQHLTRLANDFPAFFA